VLIFCGGRTLGTAALRAEGDGGILADSREIKAETPLKMFCIYCGKQNEDSGRYCYSCGKGLVTTEQASHGEVAQPLQVPKKRFSSASKIALLLISLTVFLIIVASLYEQPSDKQAPNQQVTPRNVPDLGRPPLESQPQSSRAPTQVQDQPLHASEQALPPDSGKSVTAYYLLTNPYIEQGKLVELDPRVWPVTMNRTVMKYSYNGPGSRQMGYTGMIFNRMISESDQLFDVQVMNAPGNGGMTAAGQIVVATERYAEPLSTNTAWRVEPLGVTEATSTDRTGLPIPRVRFFGYTTSHTVNEDVANPKPPRHQQVPGQIWKLRDEGTEYMYAFTEKQSGEFFTLIGGTEVLIVAAPPEDLQVTVTILDGTYKGRTGRLNPDILVYVRDSGTGKDPQQ
jgi:hypothetical protein